jgi:putative membrane protein
MIGKELRLNVERAAIPNRERYAAWLIGTVSLLVVSVVALLMFVPTGAFLWPNRFDLGWLPHLNATFNGLSAILLSAAFLFIRRRQVRFHRLCMLSAFGFSSLFLFSYIVYHISAGHTEFSGPTWLRPLYFPLLGSHIVLAILVLPLALTTLYRARQRTFSRHRRIARWALPIWLYVSVSGVAIYLLLYHV